MAKATQKRKNTVAANPSEGSPQDAEIQKDIDGAVKDIEDAIGAIMGS
jgi:hypothetical protein